jgi:hypothetical protein
MGVGGETRSRNLSMLSLLSYIYIWMWDYVSDHVSGRLDLLGHLPTFLLEAPRLIGPLEHPACYNSIGTFSSLRLVGSRNANFLKLYEDLPASGRLTPLT